MAQQIQVTKQTKKRPTESADAPTTNKSIAKKWFSEN